MYSISDISSTSQVYMNVLQYSAGGNSPSGNLTMEISTGATDSSGNMNHAYVFSKLRNNETSQYYQYNYSDMRTSIQATQSATKELKTLRIRQAGQDSNYNSYGFLPGTEFRLYQYMES